MDNKTAIKVMLCEMVVKAEDIKTQDEIETITSDIADRIVKLFSIPNVVGQSEQLVCDCLMPSIVGTPTNDKCIGCGKPFEAN